MKQKSCKNCKLANYTIMWQKLGCIDSECKVYVLLIEEIEKFMEKYYGISCHNQPKMMKELRNRCQEIMKKKSC